MQGYSNATGCDNCKDLVFVYLLDGELSLSWLTCVK